MSGLYINETSFLQLIDLKWTVIGVRIDVVCTVVSCSRWTAVCSRDNIWKVFKFIPKASALQNKITYTLMSDIWYLLNVSIASHKTAG